MNPECLSAFQELKLGKKTKYIVYTVSKDNTEIIVEKSSTSSSYDEFISDLPEFECRWAVYDFEFEKEGAGKRNKICFYSWCVILYIYILPDSSSLLSPIYLLVTPMAVGYAATGGWAVGLSGERALIAMISDRVPACAVSSIVSL